MAGHFLCRIPSRILAFAWPQYERKEISRDIDVDSGLITIQSVGQCVVGKSDPSMWVFAGPLLGFHLLLLVAANFLLIKVSKMKDRYQESKYITMAMVLMLEILVIGVPLLFAVNDSASADYGIFVAIVALNDIGILLFIFVPKVQLQMEGPGKEADRMEAVILASFQKISNSRWDEGIQAVHDLLDRDSDTRKIMTPQQAEKLEDVKMLLVHAIRGNKDSKTMHVPTSLVGARSKSARCSTYSFAGFLLKEFGGVADLDRASAAESIGSTSEYPVQGSSDEGVAYVLPEFLQVNDKKALLEKLSWSSLKRWDFNVFEIDQLSGGNPLLFVGWAILGAPYSQYAMARACGKEDLLLQDFQGYDFTGPKDRSVLGIDMKTLCDYLRVIQGDYISENPYHNAIHAADVLQSTHSLIQMSVGSLHITDEDVFSILLAAVVHGKR